MEELQNIGYRGIGEGLSPAIRYNDLSSSELSLSLIDDWQTLPSLRTPAPEPTPHASTTQAPVHSDVENESSEGPSETLHETHHIRLTQEQSLHVGLTPLERYCCHAEQHEQLAVGQVTGRGSLARLGELSESLYSAARILPGCTSRSSAPSPSSQSSSSDRDINVTATLAIDLCIKGSSELQTLSHEEQAKHLHKIAKLRRRIRAEGAGRMRRPARVRKRSNKSGETGQSGDGS
ncbi:hypothetical protein F5B22DRAFT_374033 [Xylaria bambusicola]|uniref:uncharacterized protein n=1 Tax=Xylaria bambusicola TaxID=326684 RepID=UPI0020086D07|nr:uncharacterized protein F5B22DRAFT_374033 [Xylaria bambusicola]KAI0509140.1 hypothetical protein F5B22DRAFT_374033 [Xylaria bambusicola]